MGTKFPTSSSSGARQGDRAESHVGRHGGGRSRVESGKLAEGLSQQTGQQLILYRSFRVFIIKPQAGKAPQHQAPWRGVLGYHLGQRERVHR